MGRELWFETDVKIIYLITKLQNCQNSMDRFQDFTIPLYKSVAPFIFPWMVCLRFVFPKCPWYNATYYKHGNCTSTSEDHKANTFVYTGIVLQGMGQMIKYLRHDSFCLSVFFPSVLHSATSALRIRCERMWHYAGLSLSLLEAGSITLTYFTHSPGSMSHTSMPKDVSLQWCDFEPIGVSIDASCATSYFSNPYRDVLKPWDYYPLTISVIFVSLKNMHLFSPPLFVYQYLSTQGHQFDLKIAACWKPGKFFVFCYMKYLMYLRWAAAVWDVGFLGQSDRLHASLSSFI